MTKTYFSKHYWIIKLLPSLVILSCFFVVNIVFAASPNRPMTGRTRPQNPTLGGGGRGGCSLAKAKETLTILSPIYGRTVSTRPVFSWFVPDTKSYPMELYLYEYNEKGKGEEILAQIPLQSKLGIMNYNFPQEKAALSVGKQYIWQIVLICDNNIPAKDVIAEAVFDVVDIPASLNNQLKGAKTNRERSELYAQFGFWYDAFAEVSNDFINTEFKLSLLERIRQYEINTASLLQGRDKKDLEDQAVRLGLVISVEKAK